MRKWQDTTKIKYKVKNVDTAVISELTVMRSVRNHLKVRCTEILDNNQLLHKLQM